MNEVVPIMPARPQSPTTAVQPGVLAQAIIAPEPQNRWQALRQIGWWKTIDFVYLFILVMFIMTGVFWKIFGQPQPINYLCLMVSGVVFLQVWLITVLYRCMDFVLQLRAGIEMLPFDSARIAVGFLQGGKPLETPVRQ